MTKRSTKLNNKTNQSPKTNKKTVKYAKSSSSNTPKTPKLSKQQKDFIGTQYFWGGLGIILCAAGAFIVLLWGIGQLLK